MHQVDGNANGMIEIPEFLTMFMSKMNQVWTLNVSQGGGDCRQINKVNW